MAKIEDCPGFETFGADVKAARKAKQLSRSALADMIHCDSRYLANIENEGTLPSLPVVIQLIKICGLPVERYFNPELMREESVERQRVSHKLQLCPEEYLPIVFPDRRRRRWNYSFKPQGIFQTGRKDGMGDFR